jgi:hypothetical protein
LKDFFHNSLNPRPSIHATTSYRAFPSVACLFPCVSSSLILVTLSLAVPLIHETRGLNPVASHIKFPSLPAVFSESIVIAAAAVLFGPGWRCRYCGKECDVILEDAHGAQTKRVEVKATGHHAFQELKAKDLRADILVWVRFGRRYEVGGGAIEVAIIENPGKYVPNPRRLDVNRLNAIPGITTTQKVFRFESIEDLIGRPTSSSPRA